MYTRIKSTVTGLSTAMAAIMLSYAFGNAPSVARDTVVAPVGDMVIISLGAETNREAESTEDKPDRRHMNRVLATPYLSAGRLLPRRRS
jgi:hypothetical protein